MEIRFSLVAFLVSNGLVSVQSSNEINDDPHEIQENLRNLFNSISKSDMHETDTYRSVLGREAAREKQAFNTIKETLRTRRQKNTNEQRYLDQMSGDTHGKIAPFKRETELPDASAETTRSMEALEDAFQQKYSPHLGYKEWTELHNANESMLEHACTKYMYMLSGVTEKIVKCTKRFRDRYPFAYRTEPVFEIDNLMCSISLIGRTGEFKGKQEFRLTDAGHPPNSVFQFSLLEGGIYLTRKYMRIWT